jgi:UTP:GlnB (protein PII) uridylyltransferase
MAASWSRELRDFYAEEFARIRGQFAASGDGAQALRARTDLVDKLLSRVWQECISAQPQAPRDVALVALGGYGRGWLFPYSDIDLLLLHAGEETQKTVLGGLPPVLPGSVGYRAEGQQCDPLPGRVRALQPG